MAYFAVVLLIRKDRKPWRSCTLSGALPVHRDTSEIQIIAIIPTSTTNYVSKTHSSNNHVEHIICHNSTKSKQRLQRVDVKYFQENTKETLRAEH